MNEIQAKELIKSTFENRFDEEKFQNFIINFFKKNFTLDQKEIKGTFIPDAYEEFISKYKRILKYEVPELNQRIDVLIVYLNKSVSLDRARTTQRNFIRDYLLGKIFSDTLKDAALVAFVSPQLDDWRFSFVKLEHRYDPQKKKIIDETTPAKRYSFLVGENEKSHTAQAQILPVLLNDDLKIDVSYLENNVFNIETVTEEFFNDYRDLLITLKLKIDEQLRYNSSIALEFQNKNINSVDFAKKLLGQIVFLYFLQKKGWFGVQKNQNWGTGPKNFFRKLFNKEFCNYNNFFNDILEPLFYEALRTDRSFYDHYFSMLNCKIPFLNGGLFDPIGNYDWVNVDIHLPNELFSNNFKTKNGDIGNGILDVFDRYNFTINEDEPLEKEVALDPELLGKIYEKLNAINSNNFDDYIQKIKSGNEFEFNKANGVYYTPRKIVHFICQETLIHYIYTEMNKTIPLEDIEKFVYHTESIFDRVKESLKKADKPYTKYKYINLIPDSIKNNAHQIDKLLSDVKVCDPAVGSGAFPVGMMIEIVRLREFLSLFINDENRTHYNFKRHCIENSLYGVDIDPGAVEICKLRFWLSLIVDEDDFYSIKPLPNLDYKIVCGNSLLSLNKILHNEESLVELEKLKIQFFSETNPSEKEKLKEKISKLINDITTGHNQFSFKVYFSEVFSSKSGFDIVVGNPPYIQLQKAFNDKLKYADLYKNQNFETFERTGDIYCLFYEEGIMLLKQGGILAFITSNKWMRAGYGEKLRKFFLSHNPKLLIDLGPGVFKNATVDSNILIIQKNNNENNLIALDLSKYKLEEVDLHKLVKEKSVVLTNLKSDAWFIGNTAEQKLKEKIESIGIPLKNWDVKIYYGIKTGLNDAFIINTEKRNEILANCKTEEERKRTEAIIKPILRGRDIKRYYYEWAGLWVIFIPWHFPLHEDLTIQGASKEAEKEFQKQYPAVYQHLLQFKELLSKRNKEETGIRYEWYALQRCAATYYPVFEKEKVVYSEIVRKPQFYYDTEKFYVEATSFLMTGNSIKYICGLLNSNPVSYFFKKWYAGGGLGEEGYRYKKAFLENLPIPPLSSSNKPIVQQIEDLVDKILSAKKENKNADTSEWEREIDELVYKLYNLNEDEIKIIEGSVKDNNK